MRLSSNTKMLSKFNFRDIWEFIKLLRVEPYLLLIIFQMSLKAAPNSQIVEDKICVNWFNTTNDYCHDLPSNDDEGDGQMHYKTKILANAAQFATYDTYVTTPPAFLWALLAGNWIDRYIPGRKIMMYMNVFASIIEDLLAIFLSVQWKTNVYYNLFLHVPVSIMGGNIGALIAISHYITSTTPPNWLISRFLISELCWTIAWPIGDAIGGYILVRKPLFHSHGEIRNYSSCYILALAVELIALLWIVFMINEKVAQKQVLKFQQKEERNVTTDREESQITSRSETTEDKNINPLRLLFDFRNIKSMIKTLIKKRPNNIRLQLYLLILCIHIFLFERSSSDILGEQFVQTIYLWTPDWYAYMDAISMSMQSIMILTPVFIKLFHIHDLHLSLYGYLAMFTVDVTKGSWYSDLAYYIPMPINAITGVSVIGVKAQMFKLIHRDEIGKLVGFMAALDTLTPILTSTILVAIFNATVDTYPGTFYQFTALLLLFPIIILMWFDLFAKMPVQDKSSQNIIYKDNKTDDTNKFDNNIHDVKIDQNYNETLI